MASTSSGVVASGSNTNSPSVVRGATSRAGTSAESIDREEGSMRSAEVDPKQHVSDNRTGIADRSGGQLRQRREQHSRRSRDGRHGRSHRVVALQRPHRAQVPELRQTRKARLLDLPPLRSAGGESPADRSAEGRSDECASRMRALQKRDPA